MDNNNILLITKDALCKEYLPIYGNKYWMGKTPNIDELSRKGTVFDHFITAAPSTVMAFRSMMFGLFPYETPYSNYTPKEIPDSPTNFFIEAKTLGYNCHIIWDKAWDRMVLRYGNCFGKETRIYSIPNIRQGVGAHYNHKNALVRNDDLSKEALGSIEETVSGILEQSQKNIVWIHLPHVINGRTGYGDDIDLFDQCIGMLRKYFDDNNIYISSDHGNMNGFHDKFCYGFDVYTTSIEIPLITPRINNTPVVDDYVSNVDMKSIILNRQYPKRDFIYSESAYYAQPQRKLAIVHDGFIYIYSKKGKKEELYDLKYNQSREQGNMMFDTFYDVDRQITTKTKELFFSPRWDKIEKYRSIFRQKRDEIWHNGMLVQELKEKATSFLKKKSAKAIKYFRR